MLNKYLSSYKGVPRKSMPHVISAAVRGIGSGSAYFIPLYIISVLHFSIIMAGALVSVLGIGRMFGGAIGGRLTERFNAKTIVVLCFFMRCCSSLSLCLIRL